MHKPFSILADTGSGYIAPVERNDIDDKVIRSVGGNPVKLSDLTDTELNTIGVARNVEDDVTGYDPGAPTYEFVNEVLQITYPSKTQTLITADEVKAEAERRIAAGLILSAGFRFKCDEKSIGRLTGMKTSTVWPKTFTTSAGVTVTLNNTTEASAVFDECDVYVTAILADSATLQNTDPIPQDYANDSHWTSDGS